jgi:hypothetical protein
MGVTFSLITCGRCGKRRGLVHECTSSRKGPAFRWKPGVTATCPKCRKRLGNPLTHVCVIRTDFRKRKAAAERRAKAARKAARTRERRQAAAARRREAAARRRAAARARKAAAKARPKRPRPPAHDYRTCNDPECEKYGCLAYRQGLDDCPRPHEGASS